MESQSGHHPGHHGHSAPHNSTLPHTIHVGGGSAHHQISLDSSHPHQHVHHQAKHSADTRAQQQQKQTAHHSSHHTGQHHHHHHHHHVSKSSLVIKYMGTQNHGGKLNWKFLEHFIEYPRYIIIIIY